MLPPTQPDGLVYDEETDRIINKLTTKTCHRDGTTVSRKVGINTYLTLLGRTRSPAMEDIGDQWNEWIGSGKYLYVTNWTEIRMLREARVHDRIVTKLFITRVNDSRTRITWEYTRETPHGPEMVAVAEQDTTFTKVLGHGHIEVTPMPDWLRIWLERQCYLGNHASRKIPGVEETNIFPEVERVGRRQIKPGQLLYSMELQTTTLNSNIGGNVYYQNYFEWQIMISDRYFHSIAPALFRNVGRDGEVVIVASRVEFLREIMPLDDVKLDLYAKVIGENWAELEIVHRGRRPDGSHQKSAVGRITVIFMSPTQGSDTAARPWPQAVEAAWSGLTLDAQASS